MQFKDLKIYARPDLGERCVVDVDSLKEMCSQLDLLAAIPTILAKSLVLLNCSHVILFLSCFNNTLLSSVHLMSVFISPQNILVCLLD